jgi:FkbM family methyltransferase
MIGQKQFVSLVTRNWPFANGAGRFIDKFAKGVDLGHGQIQCRSKDGFDIDVLADDHIGRHLILSGSFDPSPINVLTDFGMPGDRCLDIGANIGYVSCLILARIPDSHIFCIEPQPVIASLLEGNLARFASDRYEILRAALSDAEGEGHLELDLVNRGASTIVGKAGKNTVLVPTVPASRILANFASLDLVKIDIEGHEEVVFRSAKDEFARLQPRAILYEDKEGKSSPGAPISSILTDIGYRIYGIEKTLTATKLAQINADNARHFNDFIAISSKRELPEKAKTRYLA